MTMLIHPAHLANRMRAAKLMLARLPAVHTAGEVEAQAKFLETLSENASDDHELALYKSARRACWATTAGAKSEPSPDTWDLLIELSRLRLPVSADDVRVAALQRRLGWAS